MATTGLAGPEPSPGKKERPLGQVPEGLSLLCVSASRRVATVWESKSALPYPSGALAAGGSALYQPVFARHHCYPELYPDRQASVAGASASDDPVLHCPRPGVPLLRML